MAADTRPGLDGRVTLMIRDSPRAGHATPRDDAAALIESRAYYLLDC